MSPMRTTFSTLPSASSAFRPSSSRRTELTIVRRPRSRTTVMFRLNCHIEPKNSPRIVPVTKNTSGKISSTGPCGKAAGKSVMGTRSHADERAGQVVRWIGSDYLRDSRSCQGPRNAKPAAFCLPWPARQVHRTTHRAANRGWQVPTHRRKKHMATNPQSVGCVIARSASSDAYQLWRFDANATDMLAPLPMALGATFDRNSSLIWIGNYFLAWSPAQPSVGAPFFPFRLVPFDPTSNDPLNAPPLQFGNWTKTKYWGLLPDFGNPEGSRNQNEVANELHLIPLGTFLLNFIPTPGRGTFSLWNFDPCPTAPGTADPLPGPYSFTPQGAFRDMQLGDELIPLNGYVLDRTRATSEYRLWSFDPQARIPLAHPAIQQGTWKTIGADHELVPIGEYVLDWVPSDRSYRLWLFDPTSADPLTGPVRTGTLPAAIDSDARLLGFQPTIAPDKARANTPGTIDFMRSRI